MPYVDGFVIPIAKKNLPAYTKMARKAAAIWMEYGALEYHECVGDDLNTSFGVPFPKLAKLKPNETALFSWIVYKNKAQRNKINKLIMKDPRIAAMCDPKDSPFDAKRLSMGGFKSIVDR
jgi:uncharacterized protein YbaA (DUF1428 family)